MSIDGQHVGDVIDVHFYASADTVEVTWQTPEGERSASGVDVGPDGLGLEFIQPTEDGIRLCNNRCVFCFVDQSPARMRRTLYTKDDDLTARWPTVQSLAVVPVGLTQQRFDR